MISRRLFLYALLGFSSFGALCAMDLDFDDFGFSFDDALEISSDEYEEIKQNRDQNNTLTPAGALDLLVAANIPSILANDFYYYTNPINVRPLFDLPALHDPVCPRCGANFSFDLFYNHMEKAYFTKHSPYIRTYLNIEDPDLLESLDNVDVIKQLGIDIPEVLPLFYTIKEQERRAGIMFGFSWFYNCLLAKVHMPLYYLEHNFYVTPEEIDVIRQSKFIRQFGSSGASEGDSQAMAFAREHLINDRVGLGDIRVALMYNTDRVFKQSEANLQCGLECTIPSAFDFKDGLYGNSFNQCEQPDFDFYSLLNLLLSDQDAGIEQAVDFSIGVLDRLSTMLINVPLGQHYLSLGPVARYTHTLNNFCEAVIDAKVDYWCPRTEKRFFLVCKDQEAFDRNWDSTKMTDAQIVDSLDFLSQQAVNTFYPVCYDLTVYPGVVAQCSAALHGWWHHMNLVIGADFWWKTREHISLKSEANKEQCLCFERGVRPTAVQAKLFGDFFVCASRFFKKWRIGLHADWTVAHTGIGQDFTLALQCEINY